MALQILAPKQDYTAGQGALHGLASGLRTMAAERLQQVRSQNEQRQLTQTLQSLGYNPAQASLISQLPVNQRLEALQGLAPAGQSQQPQQQILQVQPEEQTAFSRAARQQAAPEQEQPKAPSAFDLGQEMNRIQAGLPETEQPLSVKEAIQAFSAIAQKPPTPQQQKQIEQQVNDLNANPEKMSALQQQYDQAVKNGETIEIRRPGYKGPAVPFDQAAPLFKKPETGAERLAREKFEQNKAEKEREISEKPEQRLKEASKERKEIIDAGTNAREMRGHIKDLEEIYKEGKLDSPAVISAYRNLGWPVEQLQNPESAKAQNIIKSFLATGPTMFGGKVSEGEMRVLQSAFPSLETDPRGALMMLATMDKYAAQAEAKEKEFKTLVRQNKGLPYDWQEELSDRLVDIHFPKIQKKYEKEIQDIGKLKLKEEPWGTAVLTAMYSKTAGAVGRGVTKALESAPGALIGGALGSLVPGVGTIAGAAAGGALSSGGLSALLGK